MLALTFLRRSCLRSRTASPRRRLVAGLSSALSIALVAGALGATAPAQAAEITNGLLLWYKLDETSGTVATDASGNGRNGTVNGTAGWNGWEGLAFDGTGTHIKVPNNIMSGLTSITVSFDVLLDSTQTTPYFLYGFGNVSGTSGNGYLFATGDHLRNAITLGNWSGEQNTRKSTTYNLARGAWKHITYTQTGNTGILYEDGTEIGRNTAVTITPGAIGNGTTTANYIGRSLYSTDKYFRGRMRDFRVYNRALSASEVLQVSQFDDRRIADAAAAALVVRNIGDVRGNLTLPMTGDNGTTVSWSSDKPAVITATGEVTRPAAGSAGTTVTLTATVTKNAATATRTFTATVPALPAAQPLKGYLFSYFANDTTSNGEQVYFGLSKGNDPLSYRQLNNGTPVLTSTLGTTGVRDPFMIRSPEGDKFYQIATDLKIYGNNNWNAAARTGSKSILVWESTDLVNWSAPRLARVSPDTAGNTWAPEAFWDPSIGAYVVFWASAIYAESDPNHTGSSYQRMMYATTRDFYTFSAPQVWKDPGYAVIDSTVIKNGNTFYRITKDERSNTTSTPCGKFPFQEKSTSLLNPNWTFIKDCIGKGSIGAGEGPLVFKSNTEQKWYMFIDELGRPDGPGYVPFETTDLESGTWAKLSNYTLPGIKPRHGVVLPVTAAEYDRLLQTYQPNQFAVSTDDVAVTTGVGQAPVLPATVPATYADGVRRSAAVTWDAVPASSYAQVGTFTVFGTLVDNATVRAKAVVTVQSTPVTPSHLVLRYQFDETSGVVARDSSGRGFDGTYQRTPAWGTGKQGGSFVLSGGASTSTTAPYVTVPNGVFNGVSSATVATWVKWNASTTINQWIYGLGPDNNKYLFTGPRNSSGVLYSAITTGSWSAESKMAHNAALTGGSWQHMAVTVDSTSKTAKMYLNGVQIASATNVMIKPSDLYDPTKSYSGYVGKSLYSADPYFAGEIDDFRVYDTALTAAEVAALGGS